MISCLLFGGVPLTFFNYVMILISMFNFLTKLSDMIEKRLLTILYGWTGAILDGTHKYKNGMQFKFLKTLIVIARQ